MASNLVPGTSKSAELDPAGNITVANAETLKPGFVSSVTQNPFSNVEIGRTQAKSCYVTVDNNGDPIPDPGATKTIGDVNITGEADPVALTDYTFSASITGNAGDATYAWTTTDGSAVIGSATANTTTIKFSTAGTYTVTCTVSSATASDSPVAGTYTSTVTPAPIGTVTVAGSATPSELVATTYSATISGLAPDVTYAWSSTDGSAQFSAQTSASTDITFSTDGAFSVTCTVSSATAGDSPQSDSLDVVVQNVAQPLAIALTSPDFNTGQALPENVGVNGAPDVESPALAWAATGDDVASIASYTLLCVDTSNGNYVHWNVSAIGNNVLSIASTDDPLTSNWTGTPTIAETGGGPGAAFANGWELCDPPSGQTHNYQFTITALDAGGQQLAVSNQLVGTYTGQ